MRKENEAKDYADDDDDEATRHGTPLKADFRPAYNTFASFVPWLWFVSLSFLQDDALLTEAAARRRSLSSRPLVQKKKTKKKTSRESGRHQNKANHIEGK